MKHIGSAWKHIRRTPYQSLAAVIIASLTFFTATFIVILALFSSSLLSFYETQPQITVYFDDSKIEKDILALRADLKNSPKVEKVEYISKKEALKIYQKDHADDPLLLEMVTEEILPASLEIRTTDVRYLDSIALKMRKEAGVEDVTYQKDFVDRLVEWTRSIRVLGLIILSVLTFETILVILTIIGMRIVARQKEIKILQLIGASPWYIRLPFIVEGLIYGVAGSVAGWIFNYGLLRYQKPFLSSLLNGVDRLALPFFPKLAIWPFSPMLMLFVLAGSSVLGALLGIAGSFFAVRRYLK